MAALSVVTEVISDPVGFRSLAAEWDHLVKQGAHYSYFLRWHWNWLWWRHLAPATARLLLVCCRTPGGELIGLAPLYVLPRPMMARLTIREVHFLGMGIPLKTSEHVDVIAQPGREAEVIAALAAALKAAPEWDQLCLSGVPAISHTAQALVENLGMRSRTAQFDTAPYIDTSQGWEHYKRALGRSMRRNVEYYPRRLFQQQPCAFERVTSAAAIPGAIDDLIRLHQARWQAAGEPGSFASSAVCAFIHEAAVAAHDEGLLRLWLLRIDGKIEGALVGFLDNGVMHYFQKGFNPAWAKADLGTVIVSLAVKDCCDDPGVAVFDFMGGAGYKTMWAREARDMVRHEAWRLNPRTIASRALQISREATARVYRAAAPKALREARRRWHRQRRLHEARTLTAAKSSFEA